MNRYILIILFLATNYIVCSQSIIVGSVFDNKGIPLIGANVVNLSNSRGTVTDLDGKFRIDGTKGDKLSISYIGFITSSVLVDSNEVHITLKEDINDLSEVVVTGYKKVDNRVFTGATTQVKMKDIKLDGLADVSRLLEGRIAGLNIQNVTGTFGSAPRINIRGGASINSNVQPLWVIDGAIYEDIASLNYEDLVSGDAVTLISSAIAGINSSDIEDIQVLKDASATSMYGARALNGVIVITTKSGKRNSKNEIHISYEQTFKSIPNYSQYDLLNSQETMSVYDEMRSKGYFTMEESLFGRRSGVFYLMYNALTTYDKNSGYRLKNTPKSRTSFLQEYEYANTDWFKVLFDTPSISNSYNISFSGGGENSANYASLSFYKDYGWSIVDNVSRITANLKNTYYINDKIKTNIIVQGSYRTQKAPGTFDQKKNIRIGSFQRNFDINPFSYALNTPRLLKPYNNQGAYEFYRNNWAPFNILNEYNNNYMNLKVLDFKLQGDIDYRIKDNFKINFLALARRATTSNEHYIKEDSNVIQAYRANSNPLEQSENIYLYKNIADVNGIPVVTIPQGGIFKKMENQLENYLARLSLDFNKSIGNHIFNLFGFSEIRYTDRVITPFNGYGILYDRANQTVIPPVIFDKLLVENESYFNLNKLYDRGITFSSSATYSYDSKYIINLVGNYEGSNISGKGTQSRWLPTWNIGAKWNIDREKWMQSQKNINGLSLRLSYGLTAKMSENAINSLSVFNSGISNSLNVSDRENILSLLHLENRDLTWEKMYEFNTGVDLSVLDDKLNISLDLYSRKSFDLIDLIRTSGIGGEYYKYANFANMDTKGVELTINSTIFKTKDFNWNMTAIASYYDQKITKLLNVPNTFDLVSGTGKGNVVGFPRGSLYSFNSEGLDRYGLPVFNFGNYPLRETTFSKSTGADFFDNKYSLSYLNYNGSIEPNITGGISNSFSYKNIDLSFFISYQFGNKIRLQPTYDPNFADLNVFSTYYNDRWINSGDEKLTHIPAIPSKDLIKLVGEEAITRAYNTYNFSQYKVVDGGFIRMKSISLGYRLTSGLIKKWGIKGVILRAQVTNPFLIYSDPNLKGQDPEFYRSGGVALPISRQYTTSLNISF